MKKKYLKPDAEYIGLEAEDIITDDMAPGGSMSNVENEDDWV